MVVLNHGALTLEDRDGDGGLLVLVGSESLGLLGGDNGTALNDGGHDTSDGLNTEGKRSNVDEKQVAVHGLAGKDATLDGSTVGDGLIRVDTSVGLLAVEEVFDELLDLGDTGGATNENDLIDLAALQTRVVKDGLDGLEGVLEEVAAKLLELGTGESLLEVDAVDQTLDEDLDLLHGRKVALGLLNLRLQLLESAGVFLDVNAVLLLERLDEVFSHTLVEVLTTKVSVTGGGEHLEHAVVDRENGHIEGATTEIEDNDVLLVLLVEAVGNSSGRGLVDDTEDLEAGDSASVLGSLTLGVVEVGGDGDNGVLDVLTEVALSDLLHLGENHGGNLLGGESLSTNAGHLD
mmetsp:Transcript_12654/g.17079  ORF Transcript_12654/g.17079 Transcript_12654/m.17079 type:complete len:348 (+) Transcript_12654:668-1711(+)